MSRAQAWAKLHEHAAQVSGLHMKELFAADPGRFRRFSVKLDDLLFDYSKNRILPETVSLLLDLSKACGLPEAREQMFLGEKINITEHRAVLHTALRNRPCAPVLVDGVDVMPEVETELARLRGFASRLHSGELRGFTGLPLTDIVNIGIGGSDLGPFMVCEALRPFWKPGIRAHFVSNVDGSHLHETLKRLSPEQTLFVIASKTFTTQETLTNARSARKWLVEQLGSEQAVGFHFAAVSTAEEKVKAFGIDPARMFRFWDWVGGRFSLWSAIGLPIALTIGFERFEELLAGACDVDRHFRESAPEQNIPLLMALLGVWYRNFLGAPAHAVIPYDQYLHRFPAFLQQLDMESNGKSVTRTGQPVEGYQTGPVVFGEPGTNSQHAFFQLLHQGSGFVPVDFLAACRTMTPYRDHHSILLANCLAQSEALMTGRTLVEVQTEMRAAGVPEAEIAAIAPHRVFSGNRPSNTILYDELNPRTLGRLLALYEHRVFCQGIIWDVNSFDQWGVELGKKLAGRILTELESGKVQDAHDSSTAGLMTRVLESRG